MLWNCHTAKLFGDIVQEGHRALVIHCLLQNPFFQPLVTNPDDKHKEAFAIHSLHGFKHTNQGVNLLTSSPHKSSLVAS